MDPGPIIERLTPSHAADYRSLMLTAYGDEPLAFTATVAEREPLPLEWREARVQPDPGAEQMVMGAFVKGQLVGVAGLRLRRRPRTRHKAILYGMFVLPEFRNQGIGRRLVASGLEHARATAGIRLVQLRVTESNLPGIHLYRSCGFTTFGTEPYANKTEDGFVSVIHMWRSVDAHRNEPESTQTGDQED